MAVMDSLTAREAALEVLGAEHADVLRASVALAVREVMEAEVAQPVGAELGERAPERRSAQRNGYRQRRWDTRVGEIELEIPRLRTGSCLPSFLEPRRRRRAGVGRGRPGGLGRRRLDAQGRPACRADGPARPV
jgi:transposase-like protein